MAQLRTIYVSIGNSDDKLTQKRWSVFCEEFAFAISDVAEQIHGIWVSESVSEFQNMCMAFEVSEGAERQLREKLTRLRREYLQDSIAWAEVPQTEFL